jgi:hypothetical protein
MILKGAETAVLLVCRFFADKIGTCSAVHAVHILGFLLADNCSQISYLPYRQSFTADPSASQFDKN